MKKRKPNENPLASKKDVTICDNFSQLRLANEESITSTSAETHVVPMKVEKPQVENKESIPSTSVETHVVKVDSFEANNVMIPTEIQLSHTPNIISRIDFRINEVVWAKIKGFAHWPAKIKLFAPNRKMVTVVWFNDYRTTKVYTTQIFKFLQHFDKFAVNFDKTIGLRKAAQEGLIYYGNTIEKNMNGSTIQCLW